VVTSRNQLSGLVATNGAHPLTLELLTDDEARLLLANRLGHDRISLEPDAVDEIISRCAHLPLALAVVAARAAVHAAHPLSTLARELREAREGLDPLAGDDTSTDVRTVFWCSYRTFDAPAARLFRLLGLHPGPEITADAAASLAGVPVPQARSRLADLAKAHLVSEPTVGRYALHDLLRAYAVELAHTHDTGAERQAASHRMFDHYLHTAHAAALYPHGDKPTPAPARPGVSPETLTAHDEASAWFTTEHSVLMAVLTDAVNAGFHRHACQLAGALFTFLHQHGRWHDRITTQHIALDAARRLGDPAEQARAHRRLGLASADLGQYDDARRHLDRALHLCTELGDLVGQGWTHYLANLVATTAGRIPEALDRALTSLQQALTRHEELDNLPYQAHTWSCLGDTQLQLGEPSRAIPCYRRALELFRTLGGRHAEASTLVHLGASHHAAGDPDAARSVWQDARDVLEDVDEHAAKQIRAQLRQLDQSAAEAFLSRT
jgi:hypothetical protein